MLKSLGVTKGDRVALYMPLVPELAIAMLACARIGAIHSVVFGGFSAESLRDRINDSSCRLLVTADGGYRRGQVVALKKVADEAVTGTPSIEHVVVVQRAGAALPVEMKPGRDHWYHELMRDAPFTCDPEPMDAEDMLYILYTSGTTGKPKGIVHTTGGYLVGTYATTKLVFDLREDDVYWCTADIGWVTGHSYVVYGPLSNGATVLMYEGAPDWPQKDRFWSMIEQHGVTVFYTAPTAIRAFMRWGIEFPQKRDLSSLRLHWLGRRAHQPRSLGLVSHVHRRRPLPGRRHMVADGNGRDHDHAAARRDDAQARVGHASVPRNLRGDSHRERREGGGWRRPARVDASVAVDAARHLRRSRSLRAPGTWNKWGNDVYVTGDGAKRDADGDFWLLGRVDDVINVAGHRIGTMEVESALVDHPAVAEAAVVGRAHEIKGQAIAAFVTLKEGAGAIAQSKQLIDELKQHVVTKIGAIARPDDILFAADLPKTRSGKIMRRLLRDIAEGKAIGDTTTLADPAVVAKLKENYEDEYGS